MVYSWHISLPKISWCETNTWKSGDSADQVQILGPVGQLGMEMRGPREETMVQYLGFWCSCSPGTGSQVSGNHLQVRIERPLYHQSGIVACLCAVFSCVWLLQPCRRVALQIPLSVGLSGQEYWSGLPFSPPGESSDPGIEPTSPVSLHWQADSFSLSHLGRPGKGVLELSINSWCLGLVAFQQLPSPLSISSWIWGKPHFSHLWNGDCCDVQR